MEFQKGAKKQLAIFVTLAGAAGGGYGLVDLGDSRWTMQEAHAALETRVTLRELNDEKRELIKLVNLLRDQTRQYPTDQKIKDDLQEAQDDLRDTRDQIKTLKLKRKRAKAPIRSTS